MQQEGFYEMPKAIRFNQTGGPGVLRFEDIPERQPKASEVLLKVKAVGLNRAKSMYYHGIYMEPTQPPSGPGYEAVGVITAVGPEVDASLVGKRFGTIPGFSMKQYPVLAEQAVVPASVLGALPDSLSSTEGAAVWMHNLSVWHALQEPTPFLLTTFARKIGMFGYTFGELKETPDWDTMKKYIFDHLSDGSFKPETARTFPFAQAIEAYRYLESNEQIGKVVITF